MRCGLILDTAKSVASILDDVRALDRSGISSVWCAQQFGYDALTLLAVVGAHVPDVELMSTVVPTYPRHPIALATQALTVQAASGARLTLGIGVSNQAVIEGRFGYSYDQPVRHLDDYLSVLLPLLRGEQVNFKGDTLTGATLSPLAVAAPAPPVLIGALSPRMLTLAGERADGTVTWLAGPRTLAKDVVPTITAVAEAAGRPPPRIAVGAGVCVTDDPVGARERVDRQYAAYRRVPAYRRLLAREGVSTPSEVSIIGDEDEVARRITELAAIGATDLGVETLGTEIERERALAAITSIARALGPTDAPAREASR